MTGLGLFPEKPPRLFPPPRPPVYFNLLARFLNDTIRNMLTQPGTVWIGQAGSPPWKAHALRRELFSPEENAEFESPHGLQIQSKRWPNRSYGLYPTHRGTCVFDDGRYVGSIIFSPRNHVPLGEEHLYHAMMLAFHEEEVLAVAEYRPPREQHE